MSTQRNEEQTCYICNKDFRIPMCSSWSYKKSTRLLGDTQKTYYCCSYSCMSKLEKSIKKEKK